MGYAGRAAGSVALVGAVLASSLTGQGQEQSETAPELVAAVSCTKGGVQGTKVGDLCVTKEKPRQPGKCTKTDKFIGHTAVTVVSFFIPASRAVELGIAIGTNGVADYVGDFCD